MGVQIVTLLNRFLFSGHARIVHLLLERNKSGMIPSDSQGATPLHYAAQSNYAVRRTFSVCVCVCAGLRHICRLTPLYICASGHGGGVSEAPLST